MLPHNPNLKLDNILLDYNVDPSKDLNKQKDLNLNIVDFGFATQYIDQTSKKHIEK